MRWPHFALGVLLSSLAAPTANAGPPSPPRPADAKRPDGGPRPALATELGKPKALPELAREILRSRMQHHGVELVTLIQSVVLLQHNLTEQLGTDIANEPRLVRSTSEGADELNSALPERFFVLQDELRAHAKAVAGAAHRRDEPALASALGQLTETCVACHSVWLHPPQR
jgi:hypothetical protein